MADVFFTLSLLSVTLILAVLFHHPLGLAQDTCGHINVSNETAGTPRMADNEFYLDIDNPATCNGTVASWKVCYHGPIDPRNKRYEVVYAIYRRVSGYDGDMLYCKVSNTFSTAVQTYSEDQRSRSKSRMSRSKSKSKSRSSRSITNTDSVVCDVDNDDDDDSTTPSGYHNSHPLYEGFHCYNESLDSNSSPDFIRAEDIIGAYVNNPNGTCSMERQLDIVGKVNYSERSLFRMTTNKMKGKFPSEVWLNQLSPLNSTVLHLYVDINPSESAHNMTTELLSTPSTACTCDPGTVSRIKAAINKWSNRTNHRRLMRKLIECQTINNILRTKKFSKVRTMIKNGSHLAALKLLNESVMEAIREGDVNLTAPIILYFLSTTASDLGINNKVQLEISELLLSVSSNLLKTARRNIKAKRQTDPLLDVAGSTLLQVINRFALNNHNTSHPVTSENIVYHVEDVLTNEILESIYPIKDKNASISIPREVLGSTENGTSIRIASFLFRNMSGLLPESLDIDEGTEMDNNTDERVLRLASPVISASFRCDNCTISNLSTPVEVTFTHLPYDKALLENDDDGNTTCVFWEFDDTLGQGSVLYSGQWSTEGCKTNFTPISTVCQCNHLTHFAILLSARPLVDQLSRQQTLALEITGYIGVSVSLIAMAATIFVFLFLKPLRTMRNYIHIQLCVTLGIAQIIFVAGVEPRLGEGGGVPIGCRSVAVLLHYWFLVSFMWMLMEGVVLYVALVRVFVKYHGRYIAAFTFASYGLPLLYVGALTVPLGFVRNDNYRHYHPYDYGYEQACYLNHDTSFIWSIIAPVILIFLANTSFFIMAIVIMCRHQKRQNIDDKKHKVKHWIKSSISLTVVMGITWIIGFLVIEVDELFTLAYIFTICVAFQGLFIFVIFVLLSKQVRENYAKWWKAKIAESDFLSKHFGDKGLTFGTGLSAQKNTPQPVTCGKIKGQSSNFDTSSKVLENSCEDSKPGLGSLNCDLKTESGMFSGENELT